MIVRDPRAAAAAEHDLAVVGGGVYGAAVALEAARRGLRVVLVEREDFGGGTTWNSFRILHGGLRHLQRLDLPRFRDSVRERRWFLAHFPDLVRPAPFLMPLDGRGVRRPVLFGFALRLNDILSRDRNRGVAPDARLPRGRLLDAEETVSLFPAAERAGLRGGALWHDATMRDPPRLLIELLRWACHAGATCLNYVEATGLSLDGKRVFGLEARDRTTGERLLFRAPVVVNCAGPWSREFARGADRDPPPLFRPSLAFNALLDLPAPSEVGVAVSSGRKTYFLQPWQGRVLVGTCHVPRRTVEREASASRAEVDGFVNELGAAVPQLGLHPGLVLQVFAGYLPARREDSTTLRLRPVIHDHGRHGGPRGLFSVSGVKFTTARLVAERALRKIFRPQRLPSMRQAATRPERTNRVTRQELYASEGVGEPVGERLRRWVAEESVVHLDDLLLRRSEWDVDSGGLAEDGRRIGELLGWEARRLETELSRLARVLASDRPADRAADRVHRSRH